jgi:hypothetical protein
MLGTPSVNDIENTYGSQQGLQSLTQKVAQEPKGPAGLPSDLKDLIALDDLQQQMQSAQTQQNLQNPTNMPTVADQLKQKIMAMEQARQQQAMMARAQQQGFRPQGYGQYQPSAMQTQPMQPTQGMPQQPMPQQMPQQMPPQHAAGGGLMHARIPGHMFHFSQGGILHFDGEDDSAVPAPAAAPAPAPEPAKAPAKAPSTIKTTVGTYEVPSAVQQYINNPAYQKTLELVNKDAPTYEDIKGLANKIAMDREAEMKRQGIKTPFEEHDKALAALEKMQAENHARHQAENEKQGLENVWSRLASMQGGTASQALANSQIAGQRRIDDQRAAEEAYQQKRYEDAQKLEDLRYHNNAAKLDYFDKNYNGAFSNAQAVQKGSTDLLKDKLMGLGSLASGLGHVAGADTQAAAAMADTQARVKSAHEDLMARLKEMKDVRGDKLNETAWNNVYNSVKSDALVQAKMKELEGLNDPMKAGMAKQTGRTVDVVEKELKAAQNDALKRAAAVHRVTLPEGLFDTPSNNGAISQEDFDKKWATLKPGEVLVGPDGKQYTKKQK